MARELGQPGSVPENLPQEVRAQLQMKEIEKLMAEISGLETKGHKGGAIAELFEERRERLESVCYAMKWLGYSAAIQSWSTETQALIVSDELLKPRIPWEMQHFMGLINLQTIVWSWRPGDIIEGTATVVE